MRPYQLSREDKSTRAEDKRRPCLSIILPFEPKMSTKEHLQQKLKAAVHKAKNQLETVYDGDKVLSIFNKLDNLIAQLDYRTYRKSIAILVSSQFQKVYYLDIPVNEKIIIDDSFKIRDLVYNKKEVQKFLLLVLSAKATKVFLGNAGMLIKIISNAPDRIEAYRNDMPERIGNFSDPSHRKEVMLNKFLMHTDASLGILLKAYTLPLFVMGDVRTLGHFRQISHNLKSVIGYIHSDLIHASDAQIRTAVAPYIAEWNKVKHQDLLNKLEQCSGTGKLASGISQVWREAMQKRGRLLVVEKNYMVPAVRNNGGISEMNEYSTSDVSVIRDAVDDVIEKVLETGGDVEFVEDGCLQKYDRIALILHYRTS